MRSDLKKGCGWIADSSPTTGMVLVTYCWVSLLDIQLRAPMGLCSQAYKHMKKPYVWAVSMG